jgi:hypothetical protein
MRSMLPRSPLGSTLCFGSAPRTRIFRDHQRVGIKAEAIDRYARRIAKQLTQGLQEVPDGTAARLSQARQLALMHKKAG